MRTMGNVCNGGVWLATLVSLMGAFVSADEGPKLNWMGCYKKLHSLGGSELGGLPWVRIQGQEYLAYHDRSTNTLNLMSASGSNASYYLGSRRRTAQAFYLASPSGSGAVFLKKRGSGLRVERAPSAITKLNPSSPRELDEAQLAKIEDSIESRIRSQAKKLCTQLGKLKGCMAVHAAQECEELSENSCPIYRRVMASASYSGSCSTLANVERPRYQLPAAASTATAAAESGRVPASVEPAQETTASSDSGFEAIR